MNNIDKNIQYLKKKVGDFQNSIGIILGTCFVDFLDEIENKVEIPLSDLEGFVLKGSDKEENKLVFGTICGKKIIVMFGRIHYNFGYTMPEVASSIFLMKELGCSKLILTSSIGAISKKIKVGDIVTFCDQINLTARNSLYACDYTKYGDTFVDMIEPYDKQLRETLIQTAKQEMSIKVHEGIVVEFPGPSAETESESKLALMLGADVVGFNICNEVIACKYCKLPVISYALVTNYASAFTNNTIKHEDIVYNRKCASIYFLELLSRFVKNLD